MSVQFTQEELAALAKLCEAATAAVTILGMAQDEAVRIRDASCNASQYVQMQQLTETLLAAAFANMKTQLNAAKTAGVLVMT